MQQLIDMRRETPEFIAREAIGRLAREGHPLVVLFSAGKDSSVLANLTMAAAADLVCAGVRVRVIVAHADVGVENPEIHRLAKCELKKLESFGLAKGIDVMVRVARREIVSMESRLRQARAALRGVLTVFDNHGNRNPERNPLEFAALQIVYRALGLQWPEGQ